MDLFESLVKAVVFQFLFTVDVWIAYETLQWFGWI